MISHCIAIVVVIAIDTDTDRLESHYRHIGLANRLSAFAEIDPICNANRNKFIRSGSDRQTYELMEFQIDATNNENEKCKDKSVRQRANDGRSSQLEATENV